MAGDDYKKGSIGFWENAWAHKIATFSLTKPVDDWGYFDLFRGFCLEKILLKNKNIFSLECGCGSACISLYLASKGVKTAMLDTSSSALNLARETFRKYNLNGIFINGNMESLPFPDETFDLIISFGVLEHFEDMLPGIKEMVRVLKRGGIFFAAVSPKKHSVQDIGNLINAFMRFLYNIKHNRFKEAFLNSYPIKPGFYENSYSASEYISLVRQSGLKEVKLSGSRPFPSLDLTPGFLKIYIILMKILRPLHILFETHPSKFTEILGAEWNIIGIKE